MHKAKGSHIKLCNLRQGTSGYGYPIYEIPHELLMWIWFDKYIVRHEEMNTFSALDDIYSIPKIKSLFQKSQKFRNNSKFRPTAQNFFKMSFKSADFELKYENEEVSVISKVNDFDKLSASLKGFYVRLHQDHAEVFRKFAYHSLVEDANKISYALYGPLSYVNHSCSAMVRLIPPDSECKIQGAQFDMPFFVECINSCAMEADKCKNLRLIVSGNGLSISNKNIIKERVLAETNDLNPSGKIYSLKGMDFLTVRDNSVVKGEEFYIRYANYIPRTWFQCRCEPEKNCSQYDFRFTEAISAFQNEVCDEPCLKRIRL